MICFRTVIMQSPIKYTVLRSPTFSWVDTRMVRVSTCLAVSVRRSAVSQSTTVPSTANPRTESTTLPTGGATASLWWCDKTSLLTDDKIIYLFELVSCVWTSVSIAYMNRVELLQIIDHLNCTVTTKGLSRILFWWVDMLAITTNLGALPSKKKIRWNRSAAR